MMASSPPPVPPPTELRFHRKRQQRGRPVARTSDDVVVAWIKTTFFGRGFTVVDDSGTTLCEAVPVRFRDAVQVLDEGGTPMAVVRSGWGSRVDLPDGSSLPLRRNGMFSRDWTLSDADGVPVVSVSYPKIMSELRGLGLTARFDSPTLSLAQIVGTVAAHAAAEERRRRQQRSSQAAGGSPGGGAAGI